MTRKVPDSEPVLTIAQLVRAHIDNGHTLRQLEADSGGVVAYTQFDRISKGQISQWPRSTEAMEAIARALDVDVRQVVLSYAAQFGIDVRESRSALAAMLPTNTDRLTIAQARAVAALVKAFVETENADATVTTMRAGPQGPVRSHAGAADAEPEATSLPRAARKRSTPRNPRSH